MPIPSLLPVVMSTLVSSLIEVALQCGITSPPALCGAAGCKSTVGISVSDVPGSCESACQMISFFPVHTESCHSFAEQVLLSMFQEGEKVFMRNEQVRKL